MLKKYRKENFDSEMLANKISKMIKNNRLETLRTNNFFLIKKSKFLATMLNNIKDNAIATV